VVNLHAKNDSELSVICARYGVERLSLFGSFLTGDSDEGSDVDLLVEFPDGQSPGLFDLGGLQQDLSALLDCEVDLKTPRFLSIHFRDQIIAEARTLYAA